MTERGTINIDRGLFDHPRFAREPFTEREAWQWMIAEAAFKPHIARVGSIEVPLKRGQMAHSIRFMAQRWEWTEARVRRFLSRLKGAPPKIDALIDAAIDAGVTVVTVCNYDKYQSGHRVTDAPSDAAIDAPSTQERRRVEDKKEDDDGATRASEPLLAPTTIELARDVLAILGIDREFIPPAWYGLTMWLQAGLNGGWQADLVLVAARNVVAKKRDGPPNSFRYLEKPINQAHADARRAPAVETASTNDRQLPLLRPIHGTPSHPGNGLVASGRRRLAQLAEHARLQAERAEVGDPGDGGIHSPIRLVSSG